MRTNLLKSFARQIIECKKSFKEVQEERTRAKGTAEDLSLFWSDIKLVKNSHVQKRTLEVLVNHSLNNEG